MGKDHCCTIGFILIFVAIENVQANFTTDFTATWALDHVKILDNGEEIQLILDRQNASGIASNKKYIFGSIDMRIKLVPNNSAGTITAYYFSSDTTNHDELDFEFLGNLSGEPYILQTNVFTSGVGGREQRIYLWFDPTADFHNYSVLWNEQHIVFSVDGTPIRVFANNEAAGVPYLNNQTMRIYSSLWNGDSWATRGGAVKIDWTQAPFIASFSGFTLDACESVDTASVCSSQKWWNQATYQTLDTNQQDELKRVQQTYMIYDYCTDFQRYNVTPPECSREG